MTGPRPPLWRIIAAYATEILILAAAAITIVVAWHYLGFWACAVALIATTFVVSTTAHHLARWAVT